MSDKKNKKPARNTLYPLWEKHHHIFVVLGIFLFFQGIKHLVSYYNNKNTDSFDLVFSEQATNTQSDLDFSKMVLLDFLIQQPNHDKAPGMALLLNEVKREERKQKINNRKILLKETEHLIDFQNNKFKLGTSRKLNNMTDALEVWSSVYCKRNHSYLDSIDIRAVQSYAIALKGFQEKIYPEMRHAFYRLVQYSVAKKGLKVDVSYICTETERSIVLTSKYFVLEENHKSLKRFMSNKLKKRMEQYRFENLIFKTCTDEVSPLVVNISDKTPADNEIPCVFPTPRHQASLNSGSLPQDIAATTTNY